MLDDGFLHGYLAEVPASPFDADAKELAEALFEDHDVLMLFDPKMDGLESSGLGHALGIRCLHPVEWFDRFATAVDDFGPVTLHDVAALLDDGDSQECDGAGLFRREQDSRTR